MNRLSSLFQFILGFFLGIFILVAGATGLAYVVFTAISANPPKPIFAEEKQEKTKEEPPKNSPPAPDESSQRQPDAPDSPESKAVLEKPAPQPSPEEKTEESEELPAGAYKARVTWQTGLSLRSDPTSDASRVGGIDYNTEIAILEQSEDGRWQKVRLADGQEGWVKAGNVEKLED